jgi:hypothetical protein
MTDDNIEPLNAEIIDHLQAETGQRRKNATFFTWHDRSAQGKGIAEAGIVSELLAAMQAEGRTEFRSLGASDDQWSDVWLETLGGQRSPCEVSELVDSGTLPAGVPRPEVIDELIERLQMIVDRKGMRCLGGASGVQSVLVIHTDEFHLNADNVAATLARAVFTRSSTIQRAFFLLSYDPNRGGYRYFNLSLAA